MEDYEDSEDYNDEQIKEEIDEIFGRINKIVNNFEQKDVDCVALACTDLQLLIPKHPKINIFDTMKILVESTLDKILE